MWPFNKKQKQKSVPLALYQNCVQAGRQPVFYAEHGVPDTSEGRFELITLFVVLLVRRLNAEGDEGKALAQDVFDVMFKDMDAALREMGIGDGGIAKKIKPMVSAFYGRLKAYGEALESEDMSALKSSMATNIWDEDEVGDAEAIARIATAHAGALDQCSFESLTKGESPSLATS